MKRCFAIVVVLAAVGCGGGGRATSTDGGGGGGGGGGAQGDGASTAADTDSMMSIPDTGTTPVSCVRGGPPAGGWHVSPTGLPGGDGSIDRPWDIATAFRPAPAIAPGDTVWLHGGVYRGAPFVAKLLGTAAAPITVRSYPGEWAVLEGQGSTDSIFQVYRSYGIFRDFEIRDSTPHTPATRSSATWFEGTGIKLVNVIIHDTGNVAMYEEAPDLEVYGCLIYNIGFDDPDPALRSHGHNMYIQNDAGMKLVSDNVIFNGYSFGVHAYAEAGSHLRNMTFVGNVFFGSGAPAPGTDQNKDNFLVGHTAEPASGIVVRENFGWARPINERSVSFGYGQANGALTIVDNYLVGTVSFRDPWAPLEMRGNTIIGQVTGMVAATDYPDNTYLTAEPTVTRVFVRGNKYEPGRANIVVYNWAHQATVDVDASGVLAPGTPFEVRRAQDWFGAPALTGTSDGTPLRVPITGAPPAQPVGTPGAIDPSEQTRTDLDVFVLRAACPAI
jgi:hypothetical protein